MMTAGRPKQYGERKAITLYLSEQQLKKIDKEIKRRNLTRHAYFYEVIEQELHPETEKRFKEIMIENRKITEKIKIELCSKMIEPNELIKKAYKRHEKTIRKIKKTKGGILPLPIRNRWAELIFQEAEQIASETNEVIKNSKRKIALSMINALLLRS